MIEHGQNKLEGMGFKLGRALFGSCWEMQSLCKEANAEQLSVPGDKHPNGR